MSDFPFKTVRFQAEEKRLRLLYLGTLGKASRIARKHHEADTAVQALVEAQGLYQAVLETLDGFENPSTESVQTPDEPSMGEAGSDAESTPSTPAKPPTGKPPKG